MKNTTERVAHFKYYTIQNSSIVLTCVRQAERERKKMSLIQNSIRQNSKTTYPAH